METIPALTISQPYAGMIVRGEKWVENRSWLTKHRGFFAIHAGLGTQYMRRSDMAAQGLPCGVVVGVSWLYSIVSWRRGDPMPLNCDLPYGKGVASLVAHRHAEGPACWILDGVVPIEPFEAKGQRGLWQLPVNAAIERACERLQYIRTGRQS